MGNSIREYLQRMNIISLEAVYKEYSRKANSEEYGYLLPTIEEVLKERKEKESTDSPLQ